MSNRKPNAVLKPCDHAMSRAEIGRELGITRERVRQLEYRALARAKEMLEKCGYTLQDLVPDENRVEPECSPGLEEV